MDTTDWSDLEIENNEGGWTAVASGTRASMAETAMTLYQATSLCCRVVDASGVIHEELSADHDQERLDSADG